MTMRLPSVESLFTKILVTFKRFPLAIVAAVGGVVVSCLMVHLDYTKSGVFEGYTRILMACYLGMLLFISVALFSQRMKLSLIRNGLLQSAAIALAIIYFLTLPVHLHTSVYICFGLYTIGLLLLVSFAPFMLGGDVNGFWQFNKEILLRFLVAVLYSAVLYAGVSIGLLAIDKLFNAGIDSKIYLDLWIVITGIFNTWFFLAGLPENLDELEASTTYPKGLKIFTQYVLLPLVSLYLVILYSYEIKIFFTSHWPEGWVTYLVLCFSVSGILSVLLIWPIRNEEGQHWIKNFTRFFYFALFPLILLLALAIYKRILQYGITEYRYFIMLLALWLVFVASYFLISKAKSIKLIPISLCLIAFLSSFGPWGAFSISKHSQLRHMESILAKNKMLDQTNHYVAGKEIKWKDHFELSSVVQYLVEMHGFEVMQPYLYSNLDSLLKKELSHSSGYSTECAEKILKLMGLRYINTWDRIGKNGELINFKAANSEVVNIAGYHEYIPKVNLNYYGSKADTTITAGYKLGRDSMRISFNTVKPVVCMLFNKKGEILSLNLLGPIDSLIKSGYVLKETIPAEKMTFIISNVSVEIKLRISNLVVQKQEKQTHIKSMDANALVRWK